MWYHDLNWPKFTKRYVSNRNVSFFFLLHTFSFASHKWNAWKKPRSRKKQDLKSMQFTHMYEQA